MKTNEKYCFAIPVDIHSVLDVDYTISGVNPDEVDFTAAQDGIYLESKKNQRQGEYRLEAMSKGNIDVCWKKTDTKSKKLDFNVKRNMAHSEDLADLNTLVSLKDDLTLL
eukprot:CAMPEP_0170494650 /NCGR_PEP_ID=MMETSP0208-20121228/14761_1 /TAXON_ID=197538 /ORGANISM="Strombidium inclinatum, Strain S3" /LENGTH=109 /DNA_ID=CAMNT_0010770735 /DNA_START=73 /DNA_END=402 /DNA_ORIENTATION=+